MKALILSTIVTTGLMVIAIQQPTPATTRQVRFYCGQSFDVNRQKILPTTFVASSAKPESVALIRWTTGFEGYTPQTRCSMVSDKFQKAWESGNLKFMKAGVSNRTGQGIICGIADRNRACNESRMLFTLKNHQDARDVIAGINSIKGGNVRGPISQSSADEPVDLESFLDSK
jgi:hypothetical protein